MESDLEHADVMARAKKAAHRLDPETMHKSSLKRKLEIFRTQDSDEPPERPVKVQPSTMSSKAPMAPTSSKRSITPDDLILSDIEEEIVNLTSRKRFTCGMNMGGNRASNDRPVSGFARFLNLISSALM